MYIRDPLNECNGFKNIALLTKTWKPGFVLNDEFTISVHTIYPQENSDIYFFKEL